MRRANDIGSIFPVDSVVAPSGSAAPRAGFRTERNVRFVSLCREALAVIARRHAAEGRRRVLLPAYTCRTVVDPFAGDGWTCAYYGVGLDLRIDLDSLVSTCRAFDPDIVLVHPYYGRGLSGRELDALAGLRRPGRVFVEDLTQGVFSTEAADVFDYYTGSLRKWMAMPDGAFVASDRHPFAAEEFSDEENRAYVDVELAAMRLRGDYYASGDVRTKDVSRQVDKAAQTFFSRPIAPHAMSRYSQAVVAQADFDFIAKRRLANYGHLLAHLKTDVLSPVCDDLSCVTTAPLYFPVLVPDRERVVRALIAENVYAPVLWPVPDEEALVSAAVREIYGHILALPVDQRYSETDMDRMCSVVNSIRGGMSC